MLSLSPLLTDGAVIQRDRPVCVHGRADAGAGVDVDMAVRIGGRGSAHSARTTADADGRWEVRLPAQPAHAVARIEVTSGEARVIAEDLVFGDVWVLAGQSNMELWLGRLTTRFPHVLEEATDDGIRVFAVPQCFDFEYEHDDLESGRWIKASRDDFSMVSGVGWFFASRIRRDLGIPVGLVSCAIGGTRVACWMSRGALERIGMLPDDQDRLTADYVRDAEALAARQTDEYMAMFDDRDAGLKGHWEAPDLDDSDWATMSLTESMRPELRRSGSVWLRVRVTVPGWAVGRPAQLRLGTLVDADDCYLDGGLIGQTGYEYPPRNYAVGALPERFTLAWRIKVFSGRGSLTAGKPHVIVVDPGTDAERIIDLDAMGPWRFRRASYAPDAPVPEAFIRQCAVGDFNAMIAPLRHMGLTGVLWYQGESDGEHPQGYAVRQMAMMQDWRRLFGRPDLPFVYAQLPNYAMDDCLAWPRLREEQRQAMALAGTAMVTTYDAGEDNDLHPLDKRTVGERMAAAAEALAYGLKTEGMGPVPTLADVGPRRITVRFHHVGQGLTAVGPLAFDLVTARGSLRLEGRVIAADRIAIDLPAGCVPGPDARLRFAYEPSPPVTLTNAEGVPASPFDLALG